MPGSKQPAIIENSVQVPVKRTKDLSNKLALLPEEDLIFLRRIYHTPNDSQAQEVINKALLTDYSIEELRLALAALDGVHQLPLSEKTLGYETARPYKPNLELVPLPPSRVLTPSSESPPLPSAKASREISDILISMSYDDFLWLMKNFAKPQDLRSRLIIIKHRLYRYKWEDVAATIAALQRTLPSNEI
ncbi:MAG: hypothetical protein ACFFD8_04905 [Candidatus Thorarchaeota archaeon]